MEIRQCHKFDGNRLICLYFCCISIHRCSPADITVHFYHTVGQGMFLHHTVDENVHRCAYS